MKHYTGDDHNRLNYERPPLQPRAVEVLKSNERPSLSAVFGTSAPPSGLSGSIRRWAFTSSESEYGQAKWKHNPQGFVQNVSIGAVAVTVVVALLTRKEPTKRRRG